MAFWQSSVIISHRGSSRRQGAAANYSCARRRRSTFPEGNRPTNLKPPSAPCAVTHCPAPEPFGVSQRRIGTGRRYRRKTRTCAHMNKTPTQPYRSPPRTTSTVFELGLARIRPGQPVKITVDAYPQLDLKGHVDSLMPRPAFVTRTGGNRGGGAKFTEEGFLLAAPFVQWQQFRSIPQSIRQVTAGQS